MNEGAFLNFFLSVEANRIPGISIIRSSLLKAYQIKRQGLPRNLISKKKIKISLTKKSKRQIKSELLACRHFWKVYPFQYFLYELFDSSCKITQEELIDYIPSFYWNHFFLPRVNNPRFAIVFDKILLYDLFRSFKLPCPSVIFKILPKAIFDEGYSRLSNKEIKEKTENLECSKIFVKPAFEHAGGSGIDVFNQRGSLFVGNKSNSFTPTVVRGYSKIGRFIVQEGIKQHHILQEIYPNSVNTLRVVTFRNDSQIVKIIAVLLRMGKDGKQVDNASSGGITTKVDPTTFKTVGNVYSFQKFIPTTPLRDLGHHHPNTKVDLRGIQLPFRKEIEKIVLKGSALLNGVRIIGWDIALTEKGPVIIEANNGACIIHLQGTSQKGMRGTFDINQHDPYKYQL